jgi:hypothetical protein
MRWEWQTVERPSTLVLEARPAARHNQAVASRFCLPRARFSTMTIQPDDERLWAGIALFNKGEYFACHDVWEELWSDILGEERDFIKGLIHVTVAMHHFSEGNPGGGRKMSRSAIAYLSKYPADYLMLDVGRLLADLDANGWQAEVNGRRPALLPTAGGEDTNGQSTSA